MNPLGILALGVFGGIMLDNPEKRKKVIIAIGKITKQAESIVKEVVPTGGGVSLESEKLQATADYQ